MSSIYVMMLGALRVSGFSCRARQRLTYRYVSVSVSDDSDDIFNLLLRKNEGAHAQGAYSKSKYSILILYDKFFNMSKYSILFI